MPEEQVSVLVVAGDAGLRQTIRNTLSTAGFVFEEAATDIEATAKILRGSYNLVFVGVGDKHGAGFDICSHLRAVSPDLRIVLIGSEHSIQDEIRGLDAGADDCLSVPFRFRELVGRLGAVLRRPPLDTGTVGNFIRVGDIKIDLARRACWRAGSKIHFSPREFGLLSVLMKHPERAMTHLKLLVAACGPEVKHDSDYLRSYVKAIRTKIETDPHNPQYILTVPWVGYKFSNPRNAPSGNGRL